MSECGRTPTNPNGYGGMDFTPPVTHPDYRDARIAELERQLAEARKGLDGIDQALANAEHWMGECSKLEAQLAEAEADSERLRNLSISGWDSEAYAIMVKVPNWDKNQYGYGDTLGDVIDRIDSAREESE